MFRLAALCGIGLLASVAAASATTFSFGCITGSGNSTNCGIGEAQLSLNVGAAGSGRVAFALSNTGSAPLSAAQLYFDDGSAQLASLVSVSGSSGVNFVSGGTPPNLPGGNSRDFDATYVASAASPASASGVNPGESVTVTFTLAAGSTLADVIAALESESLRVGVHAIAFANGSSKAFINDPVGTGGPTVPEPAAPLLLLAGGLALGLRRLF